MRPMMDEEQCMELGEYMVRQKCTVRQVAEAMGIPKSTVYSNLTRRLPLYNMVLYKKVRKVLDKNKAERHLRGGAATKKKLEKVMKNKKKGRKKNRTCQR